MARSTPNATNRAILREQVRAAKAAAGGSPPSRRAVMHGKRARVAPPSSRGVRMPPEKWHEPQDSADGNYRIVMQPPGKGYRHVLTPEEVRNRLSRLPVWMTQTLEVVQFGQITRKKKTFPCYGMQWGNSLYLYPIEETRLEVFVRPPTPRQLIESKMFGGEWERTRNGLWACRWTEESIRDFYLNNILIHELGHLLDQRNRSYIDRERYAEWFAIEYGYRPTQRERLAQRAAAKLAAALAQTASSCLPESHSPA